MNKAIEQINISDIAKNLKSGDKSAFESFYRYKCDNAIAYLISAFGIDKNDAYDITASAFEKLPERIRSFRGGDFEKWFNTLLNNSARNYIKKESRSFPVDMEAMEQYLTRAAFDFDSKKAFEDEETIQRLNQIINALPTKQREAVILHYLNGLTISQTSMRMNIKPETVKEHLSRAKKSISRKVKREGDITYWLGGFPAFPPFFRKVAESFMDIVSYPVLLPANTKAIIATTVAITVIGSGISADPSYPMLSESQVPFIEEQVIAPPAKEIEYNPSLTSEAYVSVPVQAKTKAEEIPENVNHTRAKIKNESLQEDSSGALSNHLSENDSTFNVLHVEQIDNALSTETIAPEIVSSDSNRTETIYDIEKENSTSNDKSDQVPPDLAIEPAPEITPKESPILRNLSELEPAQGVISREIPLQTLPELKIEDMFILNDLSKNNISQDMQSENESSTNTDTLSGRIPPKSGNHVQLGNPELEVEGISETANTLEHEKSNIGNGIDTVELCAEESEVKHKQIENNENIVNESQDAEQLNDEYLSPNKVLQNVLPDCKA